MTTPIHAPDDLDKIRRDWQSTYNLNGHDLVATGYVPDVEPFMFTKVIRSLASNSGEVLLSPAIIPSAPIGSAGVDLYVVAAGGSQVTTLAAACVDVDGVQKDIGVVTNGTTPVQVIHPDGKKFLNGNGLVVITADTMTNDFYLSAKSTAGTPSSGDDIQVLMEVGDNYALSSSLLTPVNETWLLDKLTLTSTKDRDVILKVYRTRDPLGFGTDVRYRIVEAYINSGEYMLNLDTPLPVRGGQRLELTVENTSGSTADVSAMLMITRFRDSGSGSNPLFNI